MQDRQKYIVLAQAKLPCYAELVLMKDSVINHCLAENKFVPKKYLLKLDPYPEVNIFKAHVDQEVLDHIAKQDSLILTLQVCTATNNQEYLKQAMNNPRLHEALAKNVHLTPDQYHTLFTSTDYTVKSFLAENPSTPTELLYKFEEKYLYSVCRNPSTPVEIARCLFERKGFFRNIIIENNRYINKLQDLYMLESGYIAIEYIKNIAKNPYIGRKILDLLLNIPIAYEYLAENPVCTVRDKNKLISFAVRWNDISLAKKLDSPRIRKKFGLFKEENTVESYLYERYFCADTPCC